MAVRDAIQMAEDFARGLPCTSCESVIRAIEASRDTARGEPARDNAIAAVVQAAYAAATALNAVVTGGEPEERHLFGPRPGRSPTSSMSRRILPLWTPSRRPWTPPTRSDTLTISSKGLSGITKDSSISISEPRPEAARSRGILPCAAEDAWSGFERDAPTGSSGVTEGQHPSRWQGWTCREERSSSHGPCSPHARSYGVDAFWGGRRERNSVSCAARDNRRQHNDRYDSLEHLRPRYELR